MIYDLLYYNGFTNNKKSGVITFNEPNVDTLIFNSGIGFSKKNPPK